MAISACPYMTLTALNIENTSSAIITGEYKKAKVIDVANRKGVRGRHKK